MVNGSGFLFVILIFMGSFSFAEKKPKLDPAMEKKLKVLQEEARAKTLSERNAFLESIASDPFAGLKAVASDPVVQKCFYCIYKQGGFGNKEVEFAFFVQKLADRYECTLWPPDNAVKTAHFKGDVPQGTIAIGHTHPGSANPKPVGQDETTAKDKRLSNYVVSRDGIWVYYPLSGQHHHVLAADWVKPLENQYKDSDPCESFITLEETK